MSRKLNNKSIEITDLIGNAVDNAIARREQNLTTEEAKHIKGGGGGYGGTTTCGMICTGYIQEIK